MPIQLQNLLITRISDASWTCIAADHHQSSTAFQRQFVLISPRCPLWRRRVYFATFVRVACCLFFLPSSPHACMCVYCYTVSRVFLLSLLKTYPLASHAEKCVFQSYPEIVTNHYERWHQSHYLTDACANTLDIIQ